MDFAKIYNLDDQSMLLITKETDENAGDEKSQLVFRLNVPERGFTVAVTIGYKSKLIRDHVYDSLTKESAQELYDAIPKKKD